MSAFSCLPSCKPHSAAGTSCSACGRTNHKNLLETALAAVRGPYVDLTIELPGGVRIVTDGSVRENATARSLAPELEGRGLGAPDRSPAPESMTNPEDLLSARITAFLGHMGGKLQTAMFFMATPAAGYVATDANLIALSIRCSPFLVPHYRPAPDWAQPRFPCSGMLRLPLFVYQRLNLNSAVWLPTPFTANPDILSTSA